MANENNEGTVPFQIMAQYVKDLSFENPTPLNRPTEETDEQPQITVDIQVGVNPIQNKLFEVTLDLTIDAKNEDDQMFLLELSYAGVVALEGIPEEMEDPILMVHTPTLLFPFVRNIASDVIRDGGFPPFMLAPVNFAYMYQQQLAENNEGAEDSVTKH
ncbi:MAG: protein-export chaperone SecB [Alphaproteobacteria bacterium]|nr:protein-export chaperone SecB [Alphaproteobacteria bacterium]